MKFSGYSFPHPVLGLQENINGEASASLEVTESQENFVINIEYLVKNDDLELMLREKKVQFLCEIKCTGTIFRKSISTFELKQTVEIPKNQLRGEVNLTFLLIAIESNKAYVNKDVAAMWKGYKFYIEPGDVLAHLGEDKFYARIQYQRLQSISSFIEIIEGKNQSGDFNIILDSNKIQIQLSKDDHKKYSDQRLGGNMQYATIFQSSIVFPTLIHALYQLKKGTYNTYRWAQILTNRMTEELPGTELEDENMPKIAQHFLGMPTDRLLDDLLDKYNVLHNDDESN